MKFVIISSLIAAVFLIQTVLAQKHNNQWGKRGFGDMLLRREIVKEKSKFLQIVTKNVEYKFTNNISFINATDQYVDGNGGYATLLKGGVGLRNVTLHLKSQRNHGFNFIIEIYGKAYFM